MGKLQLVAFRSGNALLVSRGAPKEFVNDFVSMGKGDPANLRALYGEDVLQSDYSFKERILETTPDKVGLFTPRREAVRNAMLLILKGVMMHSAESGIYRIRVGDFRGFQFGDPRSRPRSLEVEIYDDDGGMYFMFSQRGNSAEPPITQAEINGILQSLRKSTTQN